MGENRLVGPDVMTESTGFRQLIVTLYGPATGFRQNVLAV